jgi:ABC-type sulfate/molybdate transport systems ATPase subunit
VSEGGADHAAITRGLSPALEARLVIKVGSKASSFEVAADLSLDAGVLVLFGPSGAGKTLTLRALAGLIRPISGTLRASGETLFDSGARVFVPAHKRRIGYVPQHASLFPFLNVAENVAFGLPRAERRGSAAVSELLSELGISALARSSVASLSGGERQRVALARALAVRPRLLLLDEPFASIDRAGRSELRRALRATLASRGTPAVFVTHDPDEAIELGDSMVLFERGRTAAKGTPASLLRRGRPITIEAKGAGLVTELAGGRASVTLREVIVEGPADVVAGLSGGAQEVRGGEAQIRLEVISKIDE